MSSNESTINDTLADRSRDPPPANSESVVRRVDGDGSLVAFRDSDQHVIRSNGRKPRDQWEQRVPAERTAVAVDERL